MASPVISEAQFQSYEITATAGFLTTAIATAINPLVGAASGVYFSVQLVGDLIADRNGWGEGSLAAKVTKEALKVLVALGAALLTFCCLAGSAIAFTPVVLGVSASLVCLTIFATVITHGH